jgi:hypothetical protein
MSVARTQLDIPLTRSRLRELSRAITEFVAGSEGVFLDAGARLSGIEEQVRSLVDVSRRAVASTDAEGEGDPADQLDQELTQLELHLQTSRRSASAGLEELKRVLVQVENVRRARKTFDEIAQTLQVLGIGTRIENCRVEIPSAGMETVARDVRRLGDLIGPKFEAICSRAENLKTAASTARDTAAGFLNGQGAWSAQLLSETRATLDALRGMAASQSEVTRSAVAVSEQAAHEVSETMVALQAHDATRQALEHAVSGLKDLDRNLATASADSAGIQAVAAEVMEACRLHAAQIQGARERLVQALAGIRQHLGSLAARVARLAAQTSPLAEPGEASPLERVQRGVEQAAAVLREHLELEGRTREAMGRVAGAVSEITAHLKDIDRIGFDVKIIALNALVETARSGRGGEVLAVLAQAIGGLAVEVARRTDEVSQTLAEITGSANALSSRATGAAAAEGAAIQESLARLLDRFGHRHQELRSGVQVLDQGSKALRQEADGIAGRLLVQIDAARRLADVERGLMALAEDASRELSEGAVPARGESHGAYDRYTMDAEREIHRRTCPKGAGSPVLPLVNPKVEGDELGDNVELF